MGKAINAPQRIGVPEFRLENNGGFQGIHQAALPGNAEFGGKIAFHPGDGLNLHFHLRQTSFAWQR